MQMDDLALGIELIPESRGPVEAANADAPISVRSFYDIVDVQCPNPVPVDISQQMLPIGLAVCKPISDKLLKPFGVITFSCRVRAR